MVVIYNHFNIKKERYMVQAVPQAATSEIRPEIVNDFSITVATVNGSGSQTSNLTIMRALFKMGIPVSGKNLFPSNIQGLPTWYTIRVNKEGFLARREETEIVVAMNPDTFTKDLQSLVPGGAFFYDDSIRLPIERQDIAVYPMPVKQISRDSGASTELRDYVANMVYVGVLANLIGIEMDKILAALDFHFKGKQKPIDMNYAVIQTSYDWAVDNLVKSDPYHVESVEESYDDCIMTDGNTAAALGALYGGLQFCAWYPITPASSLAESVNEFIPQIRKDPVTGKNTCVVVQAEDELAAVGMVTGAGWAGLRAMTSTSGPGFSLMAEYVGLAYFAEVPIVIWDVQRVGPSTGLPTRTAQGDLTFAYHMGHGDTQHVILLPGSVSECFEFGWKAFDLAERLQTPIMVLSDLDFGMNQWKTPKFVYPDTPMDRGKVLWEEDLEQLNGNWGRYRDVDGDGIPYRTLLGNRHPAAAYFTRGTGHTPDARYSEDSEVWMDLLERIKKKWEVARNLMPKPHIHSTGAKIGIVAFGSTDPAITEAQHILAQQKIAADYIQIRAIPFTKEVKDFLTAHDMNYVVELNRDGQMHELLTVEFPELATRLVSLAHIDGLPLTASWVVEAVMEKEKIK
jgi:2-oxoglutarate/2-oxoacid ferredoxin oxidoreductase subunit alpha